MNFVLVLAWLLALGQTIKCFIMGYDSNNLDTIYNLVLLVSATIPCVVNLVLFLREDICHMKEVKLNLLRFFLMDYYKVWNYKACESGTQIYCNQAFNEPKLVSSLDYVVLAHGTPEQPFEVRFDFEMKYCKWFAAPRSVFDRHKEKLMGMPWVMRSLPARPNLDDLFTLAIRSGNLELAFLGDGAVVTEKGPLVNMDGVSAEDKLSCLRELLLIATDTYLDYVFKIGNIFVHVYLWQRKIMVKHVDNKDELGCIIDFFLDTNNLPTLLCLLSYWEEYPERDIWSSNNFSWRQSGVRVAHALTLQEIVQALGKGFSYAFYVNALDHKNSSFWGIIGELYSVEGLGLQMK